MWNRFEWHILWSWTLIRIFEEHIYQVLNYKQIFWRSLLTRLLQKKKKDEAFHSGFFKLIWLYPQETADLLLFTKEITNTNIQNFIFVCSGFSLLTTPTKVECEEDIHMASLISQKFHIKVVRPLSELKENPVAQVLLRFTNILTKIM